MRKTKVMCSCTFARWSTGSLLQFQNWNKTCHYQSHSLRHLFNILNSCAWHKRQKTFSASFFHQNEMCGQWMWVWSVESMLNCWKPVVLVAILLIWENSWVIVLQSRVSLVWVLHDAEQSKSCKSKLSYFYWEKSLRVVKATSNTKVDLHLVWWGEESKNKEKKKKKSFQNWKW